MEIKIRSVMDHMFSHLYMYVQLRPVCFDIYKNIKSVFIIRSADIRIYNRFVKLVREINKNIFIYVLTHATDEKEVMNSTGQNCEVIPYVGGGNYDLSRLSLEIEYIKAKQIESFLILYNNRYGMGFYNVEEIMVELTNKPYYAYNSYWELLNVEKPFLHLKTLKLLDSFADWNWECLNK